MIRRLEIENFYSIRETQVIDLTIGQSVPEEENRFGLLCGGNGRRVPKTVAFFGANASGKSNVLKVLEFLRWFLVESFDLAPDAPLPIQCFADGNGTPTRIKVHFDWREDLGDVLLGNSAQFSQFIYELVIGAVPGRLNAVSSEELRLVPDSGKSRRIFLRNERGVVEGGTSVSLRGLGHILVKLRPNVSVTSAVAQFRENAPTAGLLAWAKGITSNVSTGGNKTDERIATGFYEENSVMRSLLISLLGQLDFGIQGMTLRSTPEGIRPEFHHYGLNTSLSFESQSEGTRQFYRTYPTIWHALELGIKGIGGIAVVDEIDSTIHPTILPAILGLFYDRSINVGNAQLWFSGHSTSLLEDLRKEEIFFAEKDGLGRTKIYGLRDIEGVRRIDNFYQKYMGGVYGAVPRIG